MAPFATDILNQLYYQHGLFLFTSCFLSLIPGFTAAHVKTYLTLFDSANTDLKTARDGIQLVFGQKGVQIFDDYVKTHPQIIHPDLYLKQVFIEPSPHDALKTLSHIFFDFHQREHPLSDQYRAIIVQEIPHLFYVYPKSEDQSFRSQVIQRTASLIEIEQALAPKTAALDMAQSLLFSTSATEKSRQQYRLDVEFEALSARIKAELAGQATAPQVNLEAIPETLPIPEHKLTQDDVTALKQIVLKLARSASPEIETHADRLLTQLLSLTLNLT